jgi:DNA-directed RNA polymerase subunit E'/Rpb7
MFDAHLVRILKNEVEGKCNREGYIKKDSVDVIDHGTLKTEVIRFSGNIRVPVTFTALVANPIKGTIVECTIKNINKFGIGATSGPLNIVVPLDEKTKEMKFSIGQSIRVKIVTANINLNDDQIDVYAKYNDETEKQEDIVDITDIEEDDEDDDEDLELEDDEELPEEPSNDLLEEPDEEEDEEEDDEEA